MTPRVIIIAAAIAALIAFSFTAGWRSAVKSAPEYEAVKRAEWQADAEMFLALDQMQTDQDRICQGFIDDIRDLLIRESITPQN